MVYKMISLEKNVVNQFELLLHPPFLINCAYIVRGKEMTYIRYIVMVNSKLSEWPDAELKSSLTFSKRCPKLFSNLSVSPLAHICPWSSLVEVDEQLDWPNSQACLELCNASAA